MHACYINICSFPSSAPIFYGICHRRWSLSWQQTTGVIGRFDASFRRAICVGARLRGAARRGRRCAPSGPVLKVRVGRLMTEAVGSDTWAHYSRRYSWSATTAGDGPPEMTTSHQPLRIHTEEWSKTTVNNAYIHTQTDTPTNTHTYMHTYTHMKTKHLAYTDCSHNTLCALHCSVFAIFAE